MVERRDFFRDRFTREELGDLLRKHGLRARDVLSTRSRAFRELGLAQRDVSDDELLDLMVVEPTLLRRPIVIEGDDVAVGFDRAALERIVAEGE